MKTTTSSSVALSLAACVCVLLLPAAHADESPRVSVSLGVFFTDRDTDTKVDADVTDSGTDINLEDDLGFKKSDNVFRIDAYWRFADNHRLDFSAFDLSRDSTKVIDRDITIGDTTYPIDTQIDASQDLTIYKAAYTWMFLKEDRSFLGATAGLYIADIGLNVDGPLQTDRESHDVTAPLPVFGLRGAWHFTDRWSLRGSAEVFVFEYGDFDGQLYDVFAGIDYAFSDLLSLGIGVNGVRFDLGFDSDNLTGDLDWGYEGAMLYLKFDF